MNAIFVPLGAKEPQKVPYDFDIGFTFSKTPHYIGNIMVSVYQSKQGAKVVKLVYGKGIEPIGEAGLSDREFNKVVRSEALGKILD